MSELFTERTQVLFSKMKADPTNLLYYRNEIVELNLRLVAHVLKKYRPYTDDQYQAGCMGLILAVDTFNADREVPFPNYACFCIEREIHKMHRYQGSLIEGILAKDMIYLDQVIGLNPDHAPITRGETIADTISEEEFNKILEDNDLTSFFDNIIVASINTIAGDTNGQEVKFDITKWKTLEVQYILELAQIESQKVRFNLSQMARALGISVQNTRNRHLRVIEAIKHKCREKGYILD